MLSHILAYFEPASLTPYERDQKGRTLSIVLWTAVGATFLLGLLNLSGGFIQTAMVLIATSVLCLAGVALNRAGHYFWAGTVATLMILAAIDYNMYAGSGIRDPGVVAIPVFIMSGALLFSRRSLPFFVAAAVLSVAGIGAMQLAGTIPDRHGLLAMDIVVLAILSVVAGLVTWIILRNTDSNLTRARQSENDLRKAYDRTLEGWARALEFRDQETEGHTRRVAEMCVRLAREWGFDKDHLDHIYRGALLHDIGKMAVPDDILFKPGPLSPREWKVMRQHPAAARNMLADIPYLRHALSIPYSHHEHWDGTGYPDGLRGRQIPIQARIFAVIDQYDALSSRRPYRRAWPKREILAHIKSNAGSIFDPEVSAAFLRLDAEGAFDKFM